MCRPEVYSEAGSGGRYSIKMAFFAVFVDVEAYGICKTTAGNFYSLLCTRKAIDYS